jgi:hypothetical protein
VARGAGKDPLVQAGAAVAEPVLPRLVGTGDEAVEDMDMSRTVADITAPSGLGSAVGASRHLRTRNRSMVASPDRTLLIGSRSTLVTPGDESGMPSPSSTGSTYTSISSTRPRARH